MLSNKRLYKEMKKRYGKRSMHQFSIMVSEMYDIIYRESTKECINEASYERDWWMNKHKEITSLKS